MSSFPVFLSVVIAVHNQSGQLQSLLRSVIATVAPLVNDYEIIVVDNASDDNSVSTLKWLAEESGLPNLQIFMLTKTVDMDLASSVGIENALGDFVCVLDPETEDISFLPAMLDRAVTGIDVVFASNQQRPPESVAYRMSSSVFNRMYKLFSGIDLGKDAPRYRVLSRRMVNFMMRHPIPSIAFRHLPATSGFSKATLVYSAPVTHLRKKQLGDSINRGVRLLVSTTNAPMRIVSILSLLGAGSNLLYSIYLIGVAIWRKTEVASGWISLSLQQSAMFFLISLVLLVLAEYVLHMVGASGGGPAYHIAQEYSSTVMTRKNKLNVEEADVQPTKTF
jgi:polyisoprenyl-phosphate glycosyltransferase